jgi:serine/threonine protein kinase
MIGECIAGYRLKEKLGEGGTGETYLAEHQKTGQAAAVKVLLAQMSSDAELLGRYFAELRAASVVNHIGIADLYDCGIHANGRAFVVMEYLQGKTLMDALIELGSIGDMESLADITWQLATLLQACHHQSIVHAALKPDGIFLTFPVHQAPRPLVKLLDFGLAKFTLNVRHSQTGSLLGAPLYMSPEIARGLSKIDHRADIYSLGCIMFEMACGRPPFVREGKGELIIAHTTEPAPFVSTLEPTIPPGIDTLIGRMLTKNPAVRPQSMAEVAAVLAKFFACPISEIPQPTPPMARPPVVASPFAAAPVMDEIERASVARPEKKHDPTALLPPPAEEDSLGHDLLGRKPPAKPTWVVRVREKTVHFDLPPKGSPAARPIVRPRASNPAEHARRSRGKPPPQRAVANPAPASAVNVPVVAITASALLIVAAVLFSLVIKKPVQKKAPIAPPPPAPIAAPVSNSTQDFSPQWPQARPQPEPPKPSRSSSATPRPIEAARKDKSPARQDAIQETPVSPDPSGPKGAKHW